MSLNPDLVMLENELRNFYADIENRKKFTTKDYQWIETNRRNQEAEYDQLVIKYMRKELEYLKKKLGKPSLIAKILGKKEVPEIHKDLKCKDCPKAKRTGSSRCADCGLKGKKENHVN